MVRKRLVPTIQTENTPARLPPWRFCVRDIIIDMDDEDYQGFKTNGTDIDDAYSDAFEDDTDVDEVEFDKYNSNYEQ